MRIQWRRHNGSGWTRVHFDDNHGETTVCGKAIPEFPFAQRIGNDVGDAIPCSTCADRVLRQLVRADLDRQRG